MKSKPPTKKQLLEEVSELRQQLQELNSTSLGSVLQDDSPHIQQLKTFIDSAPYGVFIKDDSYHYMHVN